MSLVWISSVGRTFVTYMIVKFWVAMALLLSAALAYGVQSSSSGSGSDPTPAPAADVDKASPPAASYLIATEDTLHVFVWKEPELTATVPVRSDGKISLPLLNDVQAAGLTPMELAASLTEKLKKFLEDPRVTVIVAQMNPPRIYVIGEVQRHGPNVSATWDDRLAGPCHFRPYRVCEYEENLYPALD